MLVTRIKKTALAAVMVSGTVIGSIALFAPQVHAAGADTGTGSAFGADVAVAGAHLIYQLPSVTLGASGQAATATTIPVHLPGVLDVDAANASTSSSNFGAANESITSSGGVVGNFSVLGINLLNALNVTAVTSTCTSNAQGSTGATTLVGLNGNPVIPGTVLPASALGPLGALITVTVGGQVTSDTTATATTPGSTSITVTALSIKVLGTTIVITAGVSSCSATGPDIHPPAVAAPTITSLTPSSGPVAGGTTVAIAGTNLQNATSVTFGGTPATITGPGTADTSTLLTVTDPAHTAGSVPVVVTTPGGSASSTFTYSAATPPVVGAEGLNPAFGPIAGGTSVVITGSGLTGTTGVTFGGSAATGIVNTSDTSIRVVTPAHAAGPVPVGITAAGGVGTAAEDFDYVAVPTITATGINPTSGPTAGGTLVTITGTGFDGPTAVSFGGVAGTDVTVVNPTTVTVLDPAHPAGGVAVILADAGGQVTAAQPFTYVTGPVVGAQGLNPAFGPVVGGTVVTISGTGLTNTTAVTFGGVAGTSIVNTSDASITVTTPAHVAGPVPVVITANGQTATAIEQFTYVGVPVVGDTGLNPTSGPTSGGTPVTITGSGFVPGDPTTVTFDTSPATNVVVVSPTEITALSPAHPAVGPVPVTVKDDGGSTVAPQQFTYTVGSSIVGISPTSGPQQGGETVIIGGTNLCGATAVNFGSTAATITNISTDCTTITVTEPPGDGTVHVTVTTPTGTVQSPVDFTYIQPGYWEAAGDGGVFSFGGALFHGSVPGVLQPGQKLNSPIVAMADTPDHAGYWLFAADGGVFAFGDANFFGSVPGVLKPGQVLNGPVVAAEATPDGGGYREFAADGGVFDFGDAQFTGSLPGEDITPPSPITAAISAPIGQGYWLSSANGAIYNFGGAPNNGTAAGAFFGHVASLSTTPDGHGLYLFLSSGAVGHLGDALPGLGGASGGAPIVFGESTSTGKGYWEFSATGLVSSFGDAPSLGSITIPLNKPIVAGIAFGSD